MRDTTNLVIAGSKAEAVAFLQQERIKAHVITNGFEEHLFAFWEPVAYIVGTAFLRRDFKRTLGTLRVQNAIIIDCTKPWMITMPSVHTANAYFQRMGINPAWRH